MSQMEMDRLVALLEDCSDRLFMLEHIKPLRKGSPPNQGGPAHRPGQLEPHRGAGTGDTDEDEEEGVEELPELLANVHTDRLCVRQVISGVVMELRETQDFSRVIQTVEEEERSKTAMKDVIIRAEGDHGRSIQLQEQLQDIRRETSQELQQRDELTADLKEQLQHLKVKTTLEREYMKSSCQQQVYQTHKQNQRRQSCLDDLTKLTHAQLEEERKTHHEANSFLKERLMLLGEQLETIMHQYDSGLEGKKQELTTLKDNKAQNLQHFQDLACKFRECERVVSADRLEKKNLQRKLKEEGRRNAAATKVQSWWRGCLVRRTLKKSVTKGKKGKPKKKK